MKLKITTNFNFGKLAREMPKIIREYKTEYAKGIEKGSKNKIDRGMLPKLEDSTKEIRKLRSISGNKPLKATGNLYNSIKSGVDVVQFLKYGQYHREGFVPEKIPVKTKNKKILFVNNKKNISVPSRDFLGILDETRNNINKNFRIKVVKSLKK